VDVAALRDDLVDFKGVTRSYRIGKVDVAALRDVTLSIPQGAFTARSFRQRKNLMPSALKSG